MCETCGDDTIHHVRGERAFDRETCWCKCHDHRDETGHLLCGARRDDGLGGLGDFKAWLAARGVVAGFYPDGTPIPYSRSNTA